jgi:hypothetical protein
MYRNRFLLSLALLATALVSPAWDMAVAAVDTTVKVCRWARDAVLVAVGCGVSALATRLPAAAKPAVLIVRARAFVLRVVKRQTPRVESTWRMCPSI